MGELPLRAAVNIVVRRGVGRIWRYTWAVNAFAKKPATYEDLRAVPAEMLAQIVAGELVASPRPSSEHAHAASVLGMDLGGPFHRGRGGPGGWWILYEPELHSGDDVLVPDLAGWKRERVSQLPGSAYIELVPDWICEVLSPSTSGLDRVRKMPVYLRQGVAHIWLVDPVGCTLEVFRNEQGRWVLLGTFEGNQQVRAEPFEAVELDLAALWLAPPKGR